MSFLDSFCLWIPEQSYLWTTSNLALTCRQLSSCFVEHDQPSVRSLDDWLECSFEEQPGQCVSKSAIIQTRLSDLRLSNLSFFQSLGASRQWLAGEACYQKDLNLLSASLKGWRKDRQKLFVYDLYVRAGNLSIFRYLRRKFGSLRKHSVPDSIILCTQAARRGQLEELKWLCRHGAEWDGKTCAEAAARGHLEVLAWAFSKGCPAGNFVPQFAAQRGDLPMLKWCRRHHIQTDKRTCQAALNCSDPKISDWVSKYYCHCKGQVCPHYRTHLSDNEFHFTSDDESIEDSYSNDCEEIIVTLNSKTSQIDFTKYNSSRNLD